MMRISLLSSSLQWRKNETSEDEDGSAEHIEMHSKSDSEDSSDSDSENDSDSEDDDKKMEHANIRSH
jgi:hypothetical protein